MKKFLLSAALAVLAPALLEARPAAEDQRIEYLLKIIKTSNDTSFVRSGKAYGGAEAEDHLRMKLGKAGERVQTAEQFIDGVAAKSYLTGKPYQIRFADGRLVDAGPYLHEKLKAFKPGSTAP